MDDTRTRVHAILAEQAMIPVEEVSDDQSLQDLGIDSMGVVEVIFAIEEAFDIQVPFNANQPDRSDFDISTVGTVVEAVDRLRAG
ncbi:acyl carrier protein [Jannaschia aquimarina]|uniref:AcpP_2 protein n=1 Tax=Jannaschia aquimarina TaxID=935700 RepID=A0A0D1EDZ9_9RHOB|nr:acyl carrier protein [Jannaschia aquimarina]KIT15909.1 Acyl carrier protein [Jannaschia aquimarina]SNS97572.1 acyl carrier protein [Jannaschia aquimarina]